MSYVHVLVLQKFAQGRKLRHELIAKFSAKTSKMFSHYHPSMIFQIFPPHKTVITKFDKHLINITRLNFYESFVLFLGFTFLPEPILCIMVL